MSFPSATGTRAATLEQAFSSAQSFASQIKSRASSLSTASAAGSIPGSSILDFATYLADSKIQLNKAAAVPGIGAFAQSQVGDATLNIATEFTNMVAQIDATVAWIIANFPKDGSGFLLAVIFASDNSGRTQSRQFTPAQTASLKTVLDALIATID